MPPQFSETEKNLLELCSKGKIIKLKDKSYIITESGKPRPTDKGECKTDIYISAKDSYSSEILELKISIKQPNAEFLENKMSYERALQLFGSNTQSVLTKSIEQIEKSFKEDYWILIDKKGRTEAKTIKIGWKFEIFNTKQGDKSDVLILNNLQKIDVYSGTNLSIGKKNSKVNGKVINNSGVANYVLIHDTGKRELDELLTELIPIEKYSIQQDLYFGCKAVNFRVEKNKWDGDRPLAVYIEWYLIDNKLNGRLIVNNPLIVKANYVGENIKKLMKVLGINKTNFNQIINHISSDINVFQITSDN